MVKTVEDRGSHHAGTENLSRERVARALVEGKRRLATTRDAYSA
jgi:hypothetical protein